MISVVIPCYNAVATIDRAVQSCLKQPQVREIILVDDGSSDGTPDLLAVYAAKHDHIKVCVLSRNSGAAMARNFGVLHSHAPYLAFLDADDEYLEHAFAFSIDALQSILELAAVKLPCQFVGWPDDVTTHASFTETSNILSNTFAGNLLIRREVFMALGMFPDAPAFRVQGGEDGAFMKALANRFTIGRVEGEGPAVNIYYHAGSHGYGFFKIRQNELPLNFDDVMRDTIDASQFFIDTSGQNLHLLARLLGDARSKGFLPIWRQKAKV